MLTMIARIQSLTNFLSRHPFFTRIQRLFSRRFLKLFLLISLPILGALIYLPGKSGPLVFDDASNLLNNSYVQITALTPEKLYRASISLEAGPLKRPISMLSFALNHYFAGSFDDSTPYKLTNIAIHAINGLLLFWMLSLVFLRLTQLQASARTPTGINHKTYLVLASIVALLWVIHPIQLTSVLYVVQRMTELSGMFTLLALICYLSGRLRIVAGKPGGVGLILWGTIVFGAFGMLSKETTALLPVFVFVLELTLFSSEQPWRDWHKLPVRLRRGIILAGLIAGLAVLGWTIHHFLPKYVMRDFGMTERVLTESRILFFYLSLILVPRLDQFSLFHDNIKLSTSILSPWTTLPSLAGIVFLLSLAYVARRRQPLLSLGIFWFFAGHMLESTILPLELAHEHRNYLPSLGPILVVVHGINTACTKLRRRWFWGILPLFAATLAMLGFMRANQWSDDYSLFLFETLHHPNSASIESGFALRLIQTGKYNEGMQAFRRAAELAPEEPSYLLFMNMFAANAREKFDQAGANETLRRLATGRITATTGQAMQYLGDCILSWCHSLSPEMEVWMKTLLNRQDQTGVDRSYVTFLLARSLVGQEKIDEAITTYKLSHELDKNYLHPLFDLAYLYARIGDGEKARETIVKLREADRTTMYPKTEQIEETQKEIEKLLNHPREDSHTTKRKR